MKGMPDTENVGIMQGFMDAFDDDDLEGDEDEEGVAETMERRPDSPEILMNNLRGDMRSIDARREELADLVGYAAASETPEPVLAMLQPVLAQQGGGGIGGLPQSAPMAQGPQPPMAMPPGPPPADQGGIAALMGGAPPGGGMPPGPPPGPPGGGMPAPIGMAKGGMVVQRFQAGSDREGVTPAEDREPSLMFSPEMITAAERSARALMTRQPTAVPALAEVTAQKLPQYQQLMGDTTNLSQAQLLFELGQRAFNFAGNVDDAGRPLRGSFVSRLAQASRTLPAAVGRYVNEIDKGQRQIKLLAMQAAEKDIDQVAAANQALTREQRALATEVVKGEARRRAEAAKALGASLFGKGDWQWDVVNKPNLMARWASGQTNETENGLIESAIVQLEKGTTYQETDPNDPARTRTVTVPGVLPDFVKKFRDQRRTLDQTGRPAASAVAAAPVSPSPGAPVTEGMPTAPGTGTAGQRATAATGAPLTAGGQQPTTAGQADDEGAPPPAFMPVSLWRDRFKITGPVAGAMAFVSSIPGLGDPAADVTKARQDARLFSERLVNDLLKSVQGSVREQERLRAALDIQPSALTDPDVYGTKLIALGDSIRTTIQENMALYNDQKAKREDRLTAFKKAQELQKHLNKLDLPPAVYSAEEARRMMQAGHPEVLWYGRVPIQRSDVERLR